MCTNQTKEVYITMQRIKLKIGDTLEMNNRTYTIKSVLGDGATCIVYSAEYKDYMGYSHRVNIKECYPYNVNLVRDNKCLIWESEQEKSEYLERFIQTYDTLMSWQDANETVNVFDVFELNNTIYLVMEPNKNSVTYDKFEPENLAQTLRSIKNLAACVSNYHRNGYLHLDIKPSNFLVYSSNESRITLFDLDSVTSMSDIDAGKCKCFSYSDGWAAPEQKQGKINKLCPATDIYAIGAVLFEKIMGRRVNVDDMGYFAEWDFDGELFEDINPKTKRLLTNIFKKTLAASVKHRYQTIDDLIKDLNQTIKVTEDKVYLKGDDICCSGYFVGREEEIQKIRNSFDSKKKAVFLHGVAGIGKTEIARKYAELYKKDYDVVLFVKYDINSSLHENFTSIKVENCEAEGLEKYKKIISLLDERTLVIVDNFDVERQKGIELNDLFNTKAHILVSTRTDFSTIFNGDKFNQIEILPLAGIELEQVFFSNAQLNDINKIDIEILYKIFNLIDYHTYATELLAKQMYYSGWSLSFLYGKIKSGFASLENAENIVVNKDAIINEDDNSFNILRAVYSVSDLNEEQKQVLRNMYLLCGFLAVTKDIYKEYCNSDLYIREGYNEYTVGKIYHYDFWATIPESSPDINVINKLVSLGWIQIRNSYYTLHPLVSEVIDFELMPNKENCIKIYEYIEAKLSEFEWYNCNDDTDIKTHENDCKLLASFLNFIDFKYDHNRMLAIKLLRCLIEDTAEVFYWITDISECDFLLKKLEQYKDNFMLDAEEKYKVNLILFLVNIYMSDWIFTNEETQKKSLMYYRNIISISKDSHLWDDFYNELKWIIEREILHENILKQTLADFPNLSQFISYERKLFYKIPVTEEETAEFEKEMKDRFPKSREKTEEEIQEEKDIDERFKKINKLYSDFLDSDNKLNFTQRLCESSGLEIYESVICLVWFCWRIFTQISGINEKAREYVQKINWWDIEAVLDYIENLQSSDTWKEIYYHYDPELGMFDESDTYCSIEKFWRVKLMALLGRWIDLDFCIKNNTSYFYDYTANSIGTSDANIWRIARICANQNKCHKVVKYLLEFVAINEADDYYDEREHISTFEEIVEYAKAACEEVGEDSSEYGGFLEIAQKFTERINCLTKKNYKLKSEID